MAPAARMKPATLDRLGVPPLKKPLRGRGTPAPPRPARRRPRMAPAACMTPATLDRLEFPQLKDLLRARLTSAPGRRALERLAPSADRAWIAAELERVGEVRAFLAQEGELGFGGLADPAPLIEKLGVSEVVLSPEELLDLCTLLAASTETRQQLGAPRLRQLLPRLRALAAPPRPPPRRAPGGRRPPPRRPRPPPFPRAARDHRAQ